MFREFEESTEIKQTSIAEECFICGECGVIGYTITIIKNHMEKTHNDDKYEELLEKFRKVTRQLAVTKVDLEERQQSLTEAETTLAETMSENLCLNENNSDLTKLLENMMEERSTIDV